MCSPSGYIDANGEPTSTELNNLSKKISAKWQSLGITLGVEQHEIDIILRSNLHPSPEQKAHEMLMKWKLKDECFTYGKLVKALEEEGLSRHARQFSSQVNNWCGVILKVP